MNQKSKSWNNIRLLLSIVILISTFGCKQKPPESKTKSDNSIEQGILGSFSDNNKISKEEAFRRLGRVDPALVERAIAAAMVLKVGKNNELPIDNLYLDIKIDQEGIPSELLPYVPDWFYKNFDPIIQMLRSDEGRRRLEKNCYDLVLNRVDPSGYLSKVRDTYNIRIFVQDVNLGSLDTDALPNVRWNTDNVGGTVGVSMDLDINGFLENLYKGISDLWGKVFG